jgi:hypothetical protein
MIWLVATVDILDLKENVEKIVNSNNQAGWILTYN